MIPAWLTGTTAKILLYLFLTLGIVGSITAVYFSVVNNAKQVQLLKDENATLKTALDEQAKTVQAAKELAEQTNQALNDLNATISTIHDDFGKINDYLNSPEAIKDDRPSSPILKKTIEELSKQ